MIVCMLVLSVLIVGTVCTPPVSPTNTLVSDKKVIASNAREQWV